MSRKVPIVVVAYNRVWSMQRLLKSLENAIYKSNDVPLIISIDKGSNNQDVLEAANSFVWTHGEKKVIYQKENLKLRKHILHCGDYALKYGNVIILEDDLYVSPYFYDYAEAALRFVDDSTRIAGVSLYNHRFNVCAAEPFEAIDDGFDNWYFQFASSWGEAWTKKQWMAFKEWYELLPQIKNRLAVPQYVQNWPASSWLKYFIAYLIEKDMYFIYPKKSLTTNFGEAGTHVNINNTNYQVPLQNASIKYSFSTIGESKSVYDAFFESETVKQKMLTEGKNVLIDLYGIKPIDKLLGSTQYILSRRALPYQIVGQYGCCMRPHEANIIYGVKGTDFHLYNTNEAAIADFKSDKVRKIQYNLRYIDRRDFADVIRLFARKTMDGIKHRRKKMHLLGVGSNEF